MAARSSRELPELLTIKTAAEVIGVSEMTLRRWDACGKFCPHRHPLNNYRVYKRDDVLRLVRQISGHAKRRPTQLRVG